EVRSARLNGLPFLIDTPGERLEHVFSQRIFGYDQVSALEPMKTASLEQVNAAFADAVTPDRLVIAVVGTAETLRVALEERYGSVTVVPYTEL
ncbi:MAG: hypothetical protein JRJ84_14460, partial [Deltaproteobacteria bacterium]|nr:hypothetical protein [Deltaproteobacteria bacterium]